MKRNYILLACALAMVAALSGCGKAKPKAADAYQEILKAAPAITGEHEELMDAAFGEEENRALFGSHYDFFALADLNGDNSPEMIALSTVNFRWTNLDVYTYADGNAVLLKSPLGTNATIEQCSAANGAYITYLCEDNHIHSVWRGTTPMGDQAEENTAYALSGTTLSEVPCSIGETAKTVYLSDIVKENTAANVAELSK